MALSEQTYTRRAVERLCVQCSQQLPVHGDYLRCDDCRTRMRRHYTMDSTVSLMPDIPGPAILCCGRWRPVPRIPYILPCCGRFLGIMEKT